MSSWSQGEDREEEEEELSLLTQRVLGLLTDGAPQFNSMAPLAFSIKMKRVWLPEMMAFERRDANDADDA